ncbi:MAG: phenylalanine--tRNA ligase subunit alpha, partial [Christensenellales bacterium]
MQISAMLEETAKKTLEDIAGSATAAQLEKIRISVLGKKGELTAVLRGMKDLPNDKRPLFGKRVNEIRDMLTDALAGKHEQLKKEETTRRLLAETVDITLPGKKRSLGALHPLTRVYYEIRDIFVSMGFSVMDGPEIEYDKYNFEMLNIPKEHPARDTQDTFYISDDIVLRTHTSPVQIRTMLAQKPPIRMICPGRVYRTDDL